MQRVPGITIGPIGLRSDVAGPFLPADISDISVVGVGILAERNVALGSSLAIQPGRSGKSLARLTAHVHHATELPNGRWRLGCSFSRTLTIDDMVALG